MQIGMWLGYVSFGFISDCIGRKRTYVAYIFAAAAVVPLYAHTHDPLLLLVVGPVVGFFGTGYFSGFGAITAGIFPTEVRAGAQGLPCHLGRGLSAAAPFVVGVLGAKRGLGSALLVTSRAFLAAGLVALFLPETRGPGTRRRCRNRAVNGSGAVRICGMRARLTLLAAAVFAVAAVLTVANAYGWAGLSPRVALASRWLAIGVLVLYAARRRSLTTWILVSMMIGAELGHDWPGVAVNLRVLSLVFLRMIKTIIAPLLFATLVVGIAGHHDLRQVGRMGVKALVYFEVVTTVALFIGLAAINTSRAGVGVHLPPAAKSEPLTAVRQTPTDIILHVFPENVAKSVAEGQVLQIVVFSIVFGIALAMLNENRRKPLLAFCEGLSETMFKFTNLVMYFAPVGVGAAIAFTVGHMGLGILVNLFKLLATLYVALIVFVLAVLLPVALMARVPIRRFIAAVAEPVSIAFATTSSEAALPRAMESLEGLGVPRQIVAFVMPTGYSFNLDGTTLYLSLASVFVAQAAGIHMSWGEQLLMVFTLMLTSKGVAGVPRASLVILLGTAASFNLPVEPIFIILGIDELMDMARTSVNVLGNCLATVVVAKWEGETLGTGTMARLGKPLSPATGRQVRK